MQRAEPNSPTRALVINNKVELESGTLLEPFTVKMTLFEVMLSVKNSPLLNSGRSRFRKLPLKPELVRMVKMSPACPV